MAILAYSMFAAVFVLATWSMVATVRPQIGRIADLLLHGPVMTPSLPLRVAARSSVRDVRVRPIGIRTPLRASA